ncbi:uncharacterized protein LOC106775560 [Vigna radiata var. radiata]|uniref:Uncharacterized protein LOC106775560 n=1 Tax=Vigna radiata var. radiata TaxID=3916 RepID=A0A1S3VJ03_VIGRR|nr:uncharacterized protein LOC106775560 [Vigna radiata var. radiata]
MSSLWGLTTAIIIAIALLFTGSSSAGRDLRPSEHGLFFQASPPANSSPEMKSFFSTSKGSSASEVPLGNATESLPPQWWGVGRGGRSHVGQALMTASLVCGITGGVLLVASALLYLFKHRKKTHQNESFRASNNNNSGNKLQLVTVAHEG